MRTLSPNRAGRPARTGAALVALTAAATLGATACKRDEAMPAGLITPEVDVILGHLPAGAWAVVGINAARARRVPALHDLLRVLPAPPIDPGIAESCSLSPLGGIDLAVASLGHGPGNEEAVFLAMKGGFTRESIARCIGDRSARTGERIGATKDGPLTVYGASTPSGTGGGARSHAYWPTADILIMSPQAERAQAALDQLVGAKGVTTDAVLMSYVRRVRTDAAFWMAGPLPAAMQAQMAGLGPDVPALQGFFITVDGTAGADRAAHPSSPVVRVQLGLRCSCAEEGFGLGDLRVDMVAHQPAKDHLDRCPSGNLTMRDANPL